MTTTTSARSSAAPEIVLHVGMSPAEVFAAYGLHCPPRIGTLRNPAYRTYGRAVARLAAKLGQPFMPWQRYVADVALEVDDDGTLVYREVRLLVPRQSGKTTLVLAVKVHRALAMGKEAARNNPSQGSRQRIVYAAQTRQDAREKFVDDHLPILQASPLAKRFRPRLSNGSEALLWDTGAWDGIVSNGETAGHGKTLDLGVEDEAFAAQDHSLEQAFSPAMITRWSPQHWVVSTEGTEKSTYLAEKVDAGREIVERGEQSSICYIEFSEHEGSRNDPATWRLCMPALCPGSGRRCTCDPTGTWRHTVTVATIASECEKLPADEFDRAYLNRRKRHLPPPDPNVPTAEWPLRAQVGATTDGAQLALAVDITPARDHACIGVAALRPDGRMHLELIDLRPGTDWVVGALQRLRELWKPVAIGLDDKGPSGSLLVDLKAVGIDRPVDAEKPLVGDLYIPTASEVAQACGSFADAVRQDRVVHIDQVELNVALAGARTRPLTDAWAWARRAATVNISPLVAVTLARRAYEVRAPIVQTVSDPSVWVF